jgi:hypothetical protein
MGSTTPHNDPLVLTANDAPRAKTKQPVKQEQDPLVLGPQDSQFVKKKVGGGDSGSATSPTLSGLESPDQAARAFDERNITPEGVAVLANTDAGKKMGLNNLSPDAKEVFAQAHNGKKKSDLVNGVTGIIDNFYPQTADPKLNQKRFEIKQSVLSGNQDAIVGLKNNIVQSLQKQIDGIMAAAPLESTGPSMGVGAPASMAHTPSPEQQQKIDQLKAQQQRVSQSIDEFGKQALVSSKDMEAWLKLDADHPNIQTSIAAEKLGKMVADKYGAERTTPNQEHDRMETGFRLIMQDLQLDVNDLLAKGIPTKNPALLKQAQDKINTLSRYRDMYNKLDTEQFPDVGLDRTARFLGDIMAEKHPEKLIRTGADVKEAADIAEQRNPGFKSKYGKFVETAADKQDQGTFIPRGGAWYNELAGGLMNESAKSALELLKWKGRVGTLSDVDQTDLSRESSPGMRGTTQSGTEPTKITYDQEGKAYREMPNENYSTLPWNNFFRFAGSSLPGLAEFIASEGVGKTATTALTLGRAGKATTEFGGLLAATYLTSYNSNREFADANIDDKSNLGEAKKVIMANFLTMANAGVFHALNASPSKMVEKAISKAVAPDVMKLFEENSWEQLSQKTASSFLKDNILPRAKAIVEKFKEAGQGGVKMGTAAVVDQKMHDLAGLMTNQNFKPSTIEDNARNFVQQALLMTMVGGVAGMVSTGEVPHATKESLHQAGLYAPQYIDQINERVQNGQLDPTKANGMIAMIKTMGEELGKASKETTKDGTPLTVLQQRDLAIENFRKRAAATFEENGLPVSKEKVASEADKAIKDIKAQNNWQKIEDTPTFKSVKEVDENGKIGKPLAAMDDIDPAKQYTYDKDGEQVTTNGAELITHLETGDIHEKEIDSDQEGGPEKTEDAEGKTTQPSQDEEKDDVGAYKPNIRDDYFAKSDFFSPEEKEKFATLDDAGKDKMIDDKRAELKAISSPKTENDGTNVKQQDAKEGEGKNNLMNIDPNSPSAPPDNSKDIEALQGSYDRLIAGGADPNDSEMQALKTRIDDLSSPKNSEDGNVKTQQGGAGKEADGQESGQKGQQKTDEKGNVIPEPDQGAGEPPPAEPAPTSAESKSPIVGIRDSIVNADRVHKGLEPLLKEFTRHWQDNWNQIKANIRKGFSPRKFIEETAQRIAREDNDKLKGVRSKHRTTFSDYDYATLLFDRLDISNNIAHAHDVLEEAKAKGDLGAETAAQQILENYNQQLIQNDTVGRRMKSESGRALSAIQMMTKMDGELVHWTRDLENLYHGTMPEVLKKFVDRIETEYKAKTEELRVHQEEQLKKAAEDAFKKGKEEGLKERKASKPDKSVKAQGKDLADKIRALRDKLGTNKKDTLQSNIFGVPIAIADAALVTIANLVEGGAKLADAINEALKDIDFRSDKDKNAFIASLQNEEDPNSEQAKRAGYLENIESIAKENDATTLVPDAVKDVRKLMTSYVKDDSVKSLDELVKKTHEDLKEVMPDVTEKDLRDAFSGYGMKADTEGRVKSDLAKMKEQARKVSEYQELLKKPSGETLSQETKRLEKAAKLHEEVQGYMREMGIDETPPPTTTEGKKAVALDKSKARMKSIIKDLDKQILAGERKERNGVTPDAELTVLKAERARLSAQLTEISKARISPEQKIKRTEDALNRQILNYERQIREGVDPMKPREERPTSKQIEQLRQRKNALKKEVEGLHRDVDPKTDQQKRALDDYNEGLEKKIAELQAKLESGNLDKESPPVKTDFSRDTKSLALEKSLKKLEGDFYAARKAGELINRSWLQKVMSLAATVKRAFVLSRLSTFGRLFSADVWSNAVFAPSETVAGAAGYLGTKVGFAKKLSQQADRYGAPLSLKDFKTVGKAELAAIKALGNAQTWKDFVSDAKNGYNELSLMYGDTHINVPPELRDHWQTIEHGLEAISRSHGAVKGISKRMEFARSYVIRKESARRKGADVDNPVVQASIGAMAYLDATRHVLMEDNLASKGYQKVINWLQEKGGVGGQFMALGMQELMPIVKIPTNMLLNSMRATLGTPLAGGMIVARGIAEVMSKGNSEWGISKMTPEQSDALLRNFRKGNVGMGLMLAGFFAPNAFGAAHYYQKGSDQPEGLEEGDVKFFGVKIPKWLADNPYLVTMKVGASLRSAFDYYTDEKDEGVMKAAAGSLMHTAAGAAEETPLIGSPAQLYQAATGYGGDYFWYNFVKSSLEPGILQEIAEDSDVHGDEWFDVIGGDRIKRKPANTWDAIKTGIPGLREQVEEK